MKRIFSLCALLLLIALQLHAEGLEGVAVQTLARTSTSWDGAELPPYLEGTPEVTILRFTIAPGATLPLHFHPVMNSGVLLKGQLTVTTQSGKVLHLKAGDAIVETVNTLHYGTNPGNEPVDLIMVYAGVTGEKITVLSDQ